jgi:molecular chaperone DnaJ
MEFDPSEDYYALLGVQVGVAEPDLRRAWRRLASRWHPDRAGSGATGIFQKLSAAYSVLCDPLTRLAYDRERGTAPHPPTRRAAPIRLERLCGSLAQLVACGIARRCEDGVIDLVVTDDDAREGGNAVISMRVPVRCDPCVGHGCPTCGGSGAVDEVFSAWLAVRPGVQDGVLLTPSAQLRGVLRPVLFRVRRAT